MSMVLFPYADIRRYVAGAVAVVVVVADAVVVVGLYIVRRL